MTFLIPCVACYKEGESKTCKISIPYEKELLVISFDCQFCGYRTSELKTTGAIPKKGRKITLISDCVNDLKREVYKSEHAMVYVPELDLELTNGTLGGLYTTVEGLLTKISEFFE